MAISDPHIAEQKYHLLNSNHIRYIRIHIPVSFQSQKKNTTMESKKIGFIGAGQMAEALARGFINKGITKAENIYATDIMQVRKDVFASFNANAVDSNSEVCCPCDALFHEIYEYMYSFAL